MRFETCHHPGTDAKNHKVYPNSLLQPGQRYKAKHPPNRARCELLAFLAIIATALAGDVCA